MKSSPSLLSRVFGRFPDPKAVILQLLQDDNSYRIPCRDYRECAEALAYWAQTTAEEATLRQWEYAELIEEPEKEIVDYLQNDDN